MNERIKECWLTAARQDCGDKWDTQEEFIERFAELIVRECYEIAMKEGNGFYCPSDILEHFGVEE